MSFDNGINNDFEHAHQKGLSRGFDLGWSYKGRFDRELILDLIKELEYSKKRGYKSQIIILKTLSEKLKTHPNNRENISLNFW